MVIEVKNLTKNFIAYERGEGLAEAIKSLFRRKKKVFRAVRGVSFTIAEGEIVGFLGPNGAGKSTTIKMLSGILYPDSGHVSILGYIPWEERKRYVQNIGAVFGQKSQLLWDLPPIDSFHLHKSIYRMSDSEYEEQLAVLVSILGLEKIILRPTRQLSLGERMRCEFVMAMLHKPKVVFLDEPTIGLDVFAKETMRNFIRQMNARFHTTFIVTSHDLEDIEHLCHRVIVINEGKIVFNDSMNKLKGYHRKIITIKYYEPIDPKTLIMRGIRVTDVISPYVLRLSVNTAKLQVDEVIRKIRKKPIEDLEISNPPITEIIKKLYE